MDSYGQLRKSKNNYENLQTAKDHRTLTNAYGPRAGALLISLIDPMIDQKNAGIGSFFGVENRKIPAFRVFFYSQ